MVCDTGLGIPTKKMPHLFVPFDRLGAEQLDYLTKPIDMSPSLEIMDAMPAKKKP